MNGPIRNKEIEQEMISICSEIWAVIGIGKMPRIESKYGGSTGVCWGSTLVQFRWTSWRKMPLAGKRMIAIHELWHATGHGHDSKSLFCSAFDIITLELYKLIYGEDEPLKSVVDDLRKTAKEIIDYSASLRNNL